MSADRPHSSRTTRRGMWTVLAMFLVGAAVLWGLFLVPRERAASTPAPASPRGVPGRTLRFLNYDVAEDLASTEAVAAKFRALADEGPIDFVMLQRVRADQVLLLVDGLRMQSSYRPEHFRRVGPAGERASSGCLLLSASTLYELTPIRERDGDEVVGARAEAVVDGRRFTVACVGTGDDSMLIALDSPSVVGGRTLGELSFSPEWVVKAECAEPVGTSGRSIHVVEAHGEEPSTAPGGSAR